MVEVGSQNWYRGFPLLRYFALFYFRDYLKEWQDKGVSVVLWTVNHSAEKDYFSGVLRCPVMTDYVKGDSQQNIS